MQKINKTNNMGSGETRAGEPEPEPEPDTLGAGSIWILVAGALEVEA